MADGAWARIVRVSGTGNGLLLECLRESLIDATA
jgi:hypothetical protein